MTAGADSDGLAAALIQISSHAERISALDTREAGHYRDIAERLSALASDVGSLGARVDEVGAALVRQSSILASLDGLDRQVAALVAQIGELTEDDNAGEGPRYQAVTPPRWWKLGGPDREAALDRLRAWVERIYRPGYGKLAATLPPCWEQHPLCLYALDWLSELWSVLYLNPQRSPGVLAAQAEWQTRLLPAIAEQMAYETNGCPPARPPPQGRAEPGPGTGATGCPDPVIDHCDNRAPELGV